MEKAEIIVGCLVVWLFGQIAYCIFDAMREQARDSRENKLFYKNHRDEDKEEEDEK